MSARITESLHYNGESVSAWLEGLERGDDSERRRAAEALIGISTGLTEVLPSLSGALKHGDPAARAQTATAIGTLAARMTAALPMLQAALKALVLTEADEAVRTSALQALSLFDPVTRQQVPRLIQALRDELSYLRANAANALGQLGTQAQEAVPALTSATLYDPDFRVRLEAAVALWRIDRRVVRSLPVLIEALRAEDDYLRWVAADCLGDMGPEAREAVLPLVEALRGPIKARLVRMSVRLALERIDAEAAEQAGVE
jgi:HEAT repeat protein